MRIITSKLTFFLILATQLACCDNKKSSLSSNAGLPEMKIEFLSLVRDRDYGECASFAIRNTGSIPIRINIYLEDGVNVYDQPLYDRFVNGQWMSVEVGYAGCNLYSELSTGKEYHFIAPLYLIEDSPLDTYRLKVADSSARMYYSNKFNISSHNPGADKPTSPE